MIQWYANYDNLIEKIAPDYKNTLNAILNNIPSCKNIIELGCGTGNLTEKLALNFSETTIHSIDNNLQVLAKVKEKIKKFNNVKLHNLNILYYNFSEKDIVIGSYIFHLIPKIERYKLFKRMMQQEVSTIFIADRLSHKDEKFVYNFRINNNLSKDFVNKIFIENKNNQLDKIEDQMTFFRKQGYSFDMLFSNPHHGFKAYSYRRI